MKASLCAAWRRGSLGGLSKTTNDVVTVLDAAGFDRILVETVGVGQAEVEIASMAHTTLVVEAPGMGDEVQAIKAGILEIADILVVNKADRPGVDKTVQALEMMLETEGSNARQLRHHGQVLAVQAAVDPAEEAARWAVKVMKTISTTGDGIDDLRQRIEAHARGCMSPGKSLARAGANCTYAGKHHSRRIKPAHQGPFANGKVERRRRGRAPAGERPVYGGE
ncbi:MAG: hypothetical protein U0350_26385 [Caldilineaceae bacterium]